MPAVNVMQVVLVDQNVEINSGFITLLDKHMCGPSGLDSEFWGLSCEAACSQSFCSSGRDCARKDFGDRY